MVEKQSISIIGARWGKKKEYRFIVPEPCLPQVNKGPVFLRLGLICTYAIGAI
jgi:hypothetical protein